MRLLDVSWVKTNFLVALVSTSFVINPLSYADTVIGFNTDGSPKYAPEPPGASGPIATPENPFWIKNPDGSATEAEKNYTFIPGAENPENKIANKDPFFGANTPEGMIQIGFNIDGSPKFAPEPPGASGPIATPENPGWIRNPDGTMTAAEKGYTFLPNAEEAAKTASIGELKSLIEKEITSSTFKKVKKSNKFLLTSSVEMSATGSSIKAIAVKNGASSKNIAFSYTEDGQLVLQASDKLKGYQVQILNENKILKKIKL
jgi:hypothetical protein